MPKKPGNDAAAPDTSETPTTPGSDVWAGQGSVTRRTFVEQSGRFLVLVTVGACTSETPRVTGTGPPTVTYFGSLRVRVNGLTSGATTGGQATAARVSSNDVTVFDIVASPADLTLSVPIGDYRVAYVPPAGFGVLPGQGAPVDARVAINTVTAVVFSVVPLPIIGTMQISVSGLPGTSNGGTVSAQRTDAAGTATILVTGAGTGSMSVPAGIYDVTYNPPTGYTVSSVTPNPATGVIVGNGATTSVSYAVTPVVTTGGVRVTINGLSSSPEGGRISALMTDGSGQTFFDDLAAPVSGTSTGHLAGMPPGSYDVTFTAPVGYQLVAGSLNPRVVTISAGVTADVALDAEAAPQQPGLVFASDWDAATGVSLSALLDGGKWDNLIDGGGPSNRLEVIPSAGLDFPVGMANVLAVLYDDANMDSYWNVNVRNGWPLPPVGGSIHFRIYARHDIGEASGGYLDSIQTGPPGTCQMTSKLRFARPASASSTTLDFAVSHGGGSAGSGNAHEWQTQLTRAATYRIEEKYTRQGTNSWTVDARVYDSSGTLIRQASDFVCALHPGHTMQSYAGTITSGTNCFGNKMLGQPSAPGRGSSDPAHQHIYFGGFAVSLSDWCGPYTPGE